jgi:DNA-binding NarL/FixJ family response regulator
MVEPVFVGRRAEMGALSDALARARDGAPSTVLIGGEAGVGKSRIVEEFTRRVGDTAHVLIGGCVDLGADGLPFAPLTAALRGLLHEIGADGIRGLLPGIDAPELARLLPSLGGREAARDAPSARPRLFEELLTLLENLARDRPAVLVVEDAHWADRSSRDLLDFLVRNQQAMPSLLLVVTYRADELDRVHPLRSMLAQLRRVRWVEQLQLHRLSRPDVVAQMRGLLGHDPEPALVESIFGRSEGNPLFVESLLAYADGSPADLPESLRDLLLAPVHRLSPETRQVMMVAATGGVRLPHALLAAASGLADAALTYLLRPAVAANVLTVEGDTYVFRHALIREAIAADRLPGERVRLHTRYAEALEADPALVPDGRAGIEAAHHWFATYDRPRALESAWLAAGEAATLLAYAERLHLLSRVLDLWDLVPDAADRIEIGHAALLEAAAESAILAGEHERGEALVSAALAEIDWEREPRRAAVLRERRGFTRYQLGRAGDVEDLREALRLVAADRAARAPLLATLALRLMVVPLPEEARESAEKALADARHAGDARAEATALIALAVLNGRRGDLPDQLLRLREAQAIALRLGARDALTRAIHWETALLEAYGEYELAAAVATRGLAAAQDAGLARTAGVLHACDLASAVMRLGRWDEALDLVGDELDRVPPAMQRAQLLQIRGFIELARGNLEAAAAAVRYGREVAPARDASNADEVLPLTQLEAELRLAEGHREDARALVEEQLTDADATLGWSAAWPFLVTAARAAGTAPAVAAGRLQAIGPVQQANRLTFVAESTRAAGQLDRAAWDAAVTAWEVLEDPFSLAQALFRAAEAALAGDGDRAAAAARVRRAAELADQLGAGPLRKQIGLLARRARLGLASGEAPHEEDRARRLGLTARELDVVRLVAAGHGNRQIATELFISPKTASVHVSNIIAKLGVSGRGEAAAAAHRLGLVDDAP